MEKEAKFKEELIKEIGLLRKRIVELEAADGARKQQQQQQQQQIRRLAAVMRDANDAIIMQDIDGRITAWNRGAESMYGYSEKEAVGMNIGRLTPPDKEVEHGEFTRRLIEGEAVTSFETLRVTKDGRILDIWLTVTKITEDPSDSIVSTGRDITKPIGIAMIERNITERKQAEEALRESEKKYRLLVEQVPVHIYTAALNESSTTTYASPHIEKILGFTLAEFAADPDIWSHQIYPDDRERVTAALARTHKEQVPFISEYRMFTRDGKIVWVHDEARVLSDSEGKPLYLQGIMFDVTERKRMEKDLQERLDELQRERKVMMGREERVIELKKEVDAALMAAGRPPKYSK